jgi:PleD family two-component response regulator
VTSETIRVLLVSADSSDQSIFESKLRSSAHRDVELTRLDTVPAACERLTEESWDVVLLDLALTLEQGLDGFIRLNAQVPETPVVVIASPATQSLAALALDAGAADSLIRPSLRSEPVGDILVAIIQRTRFNEAIRKRELMDRQTGLYSLEGFRRTIGKQLSLAVHGGKALLMTRLTAEGEPSIKQIEAVAHILKLSFREADRVAHLGGGSFAAIGIIQPVPESREIVLTRLREQLHAYNATGDAPPLELKFGMEIVNATPALDADAMIEALPPADQTL